MLFKKNIRQIVTFLYAFYLKKMYNVKIKSNVIISKNTDFEGLNVIHSGVNIYDSSIGFASYIGNNTKLSNTQIGKYCSIAHEVELLESTHPTSGFASTHPAFFSLLKQSGFTFVNKQLFQEELFFDKKKNIKLKIGNDVWIGAKVIIIAGIEIGDGAIIGAGSIVTKNVPPYAIVVGVPAKIIKFRFDEATIDKLLKFKWWNKDKAWLENNYNNILNII